MGPSSRRPFATSAYAAALLIVLVGTFLLAEVFRHSTLKSTDGSRDLPVAIEAYQVDMARYPIEAVGNERNGPSSLSEVDPACWEMSAIIPDCYEDAQNSQNTALGRTQTPSGALNGPSAALKYGTTPTVSTANLYDPTNGTVSAGDVMRVRQ